MIRPSLFLDDGRASDKRHASMLLRTYPPEETSFQLFQDRNIYDSLFLYRRRSCAYSLTPHWAQTASAAAHGVSCSRPLSVMADRAIMTGILLSPPGSGPREYCPCQRYILSNSFSTFQSWSISSDILSTPQQLTLVNATSWTKFDIALRYLAKGHSAL
jgi:hypothetical protein